VDSGARVATHAAPATPFDVRLLADERVALLGCADGSLVFLDVIDGAVLHKIVSHKDAVMAVAIDPTGAVAATASRDRTVKIFDLARRTEIAALSGHDASVVAVTLLPGGARAVSIDTDGRCIVWDVARGSAEGELTSEERETVPTPRVKWELSGPELRVVRRPSAVAALGDDRHVAVATRASIAIWDAVARRLVATLEDPRCRLVEDLRVSHDRRLLLSRDDRQSCGVWDVSARRALAFFTFGASTLVCDVGGATPTIAAGCSGLVRDVVFLRLEQPGI
jgi:WD40 repeat protein